MSRSVRAGDRHGPWRAQACLDHRVTLVITLGIALAAVFGTSNAVAEAASPVPVVALIPYTSPGSYVSGQLIEVRLASNPILKPGARLIINECSSASVHKALGHYDCDTRTRQLVRFSANRDGSADYQGYPIYALPDVTTHETHHHRPVCNLAHACVLMIGWDLDDPGHRVWSLPFFVIPLAGGTGTDPGTGTPEVPYVLALPAIAVGIFGATVLVRRRRSTVGRQT